MQRFRTGRHLFEDGQCHITNTMQKVPSSCVLAASCQCFKQWKDKPTDCAPYNQQLFKKNENTCFTQCLLITETVIVLPSVSHLWHWLLPSLGDGLCTALVLHISKLQGHKWLCIFFKRKSAFVRSFRRVFREKKKRKRKKCTKTRSLFSLSQVTQQVNTFMARSEPHLNRAKVNDPSKQDQTTRQ